MKKKNQHIVIAVMVSIFCLSLAPSLCPKAQADNTCTPSNSNSIKGNGEYSLRISERNFSDGHLYQNFVHQGTKINVHSGQIDVGGNGYIDNSTKKEIDPNTGATVNWSRGKFNSNWRIEIGEGGVDIDTTHFVSSAYQKNATHLRNSFTKDGLKFEGYTNAGGEIQFSGVEKIDGSKIGTKSFHADGEVSVVSWQSPDGKNHGSEISTKMSQSGDFSSLSKTQARQMGQINARTIVSPTTPTCSNQVKSVGKLNYNLGANTNAGGRIDTYANMQTWKGGKYATGEVFVKVKKGGQ